MQILAKRLKELREERRIYQHSRVSIDYLVGRTDAPDFQPVQTEE